MASRTFSVVPGDSLDYQLAFEARSAVVNNPTPCFWYAPGADVWVLPYTYGQTFLLPAAPQVAILDFTAPVGQVQPSPITNTVSPLSITYYSTIAGPASPGINVPISQGRAPLSFNFTATGQSLRFQTSSPIDTGFTCRVESNGALSSLTLTFSWALPGSNARSETYYGALNAATAIDFDIPGSFPPGTAFTLTAVYAIPQTVIVWIL